MARFYAKSNRPTEAIAAYCRAVDVCDKQTRLSEGLAYCSELLAIDPNNTTVLLSCAQYCEGLARYAEAVDFYKRALNALPHDRRLSSISTLWAAQMHITLGTCYRKLQMTKEAEAAYLRMS